MPSSASRPESLWGARYVSRTNKCAWLSCVAGARGAHCGYWVGPALCPRGSPPPLAKGLLRAQDWRVLAPWKASTPQEPRREAAPIAHGNGSGDGSAAGSEAGLGAGGLRCSVEGHHQDCRAGVVTRLESQACRTRGVRTQPLSWPWALGPPPLFPLTWPPVRPLSCPHTQSSQLEPSDASEGRRQKEVPASSDQDRDRPKFKSLLPRGPYMCP